MFLEILKAKEASMILDAMGSWLVSFTPFFFLCLMIPSFIIGDNDPEKTKRKIIELAIPATMIVAWILLTDAFQNFSEQQTVYTRMSFILWTALVGAGIYGGASLISVIPQPKALFLNRKHTKPLWAAFFFIIGTSVTITVSNVHLSSLISFEASRLYSALMLVTFFRLRKKRGHVSVAMMARSSLTVGKVILGISYLWMLSDLSDPSRLGGALAVGVVGSMYSLLAYCLLTLLKPLFQSTMCPKEEVHLNMGRFFWTHLFLIAAQVILVFFAVGYS
jgi:hypothetical protein